SEKKWVEQIQQCKQNLEQLKVQAEQAERAADYGQVAEIRYGKMKSVETELQSLLGTTEKRRERRQITQRSR
ncbi:MAG: ATP-dependent chaperone ClpB, partial [Bacteroidota bacterium]